jgi:putative membrane protein
MTAFIRSICLAALLAAGSAYAQQQVDDPANPHSTKAKDKQGSSTPSSTTNDQTQQAEQPNPHAVNNRDAKAAGDTSKSQIDAAETNNPHHVTNKDRDRMGTAAMPAGQDQMASMDHDAMMQNATPQMVLQKIHAKNLEEIDMGKLAQDKGSDRIKQYAQTLQTDHQSADQKVQDLAKRKGFTLSDTAKNPEKQQKMQQMKDRLSALSGTEFDRAFANSMAMDHKHVISMLQGWRPNCKDQDVCGLVDTLLPKLQQHQQMADQLKGPTAQGRTPESR